MSGFLSSRARILAAEILALVASGAKELSLPRDREVKTTAPYTLKQTPRQLTQHHWVWPHELEKVFIDGQVPHHQESPDIEAC